MNRKQLDAFINLFTDDIRSAFITAMRDVVDNAILEQVIRAIQSGNIQAAFEALGWSPAMLRPITAAIERAYERGGVLTGEGFPKYLATSNGRAVFRFDVRDSRAEAWLRDRSSTLITRIEDETRNNIRNIVQVGLQEGRNPRNVALDIIGRVDRVSGHRVGGIIGLTPRQESWARNVERDLRALSPDYFNRRLRDKRFDGTVRRAIESGKPLTADQIQKLVSRYRDNALQFRGETIARTETLAALAASDHEATRQAVAAGAARPQDVKRVWDSAGDRRVRHSHKQMDGQAVGLEEAFRTPSGDLLMYPGDTSLGADGEETIMCRCRVRTEIDWLAAVT